MKLHVIGILTFGAMINFGIGPVAADPAFECSVATSSQVETADCVAETEDRVNQVLSATMQIAEQQMAELDDVTGRDDASRALLASQTAWEAHRDAHCDLIGATFGGGSGTGIAIRSCRVELTRARIQALLELAN